MQNFTLKFGKYKGQQFLSTPTNYQNWLLSQDWFKMPTVLTELQQAEKILSECATKLKGWDGYSRKGAAIYDQMFDAEKAMDAAIFNSYDQSSPYWNGEMSFDY
jgi:uncharacterized protein (DUF3820 family)